MNGWGSACHIALFSTELTLISRGLGKKAEAKDIVGEESYVAWIPSTKLLSKG